MLAVVALACYALNYSAWQSYSIFRRRLTDSSFNVTLVAVLLQTAIACCLPLLLLAGGRRQFVVLHYISGFAHLLFVIINATQSCCCTYCCCYYYYCWYLGAVMFSFLHSISFKCDFLYLCVCVCVYVCFRILLTAHPSTAMCVYMCWLIASLLEYFT